MGYSFSEGKCKQIGVDENGLCFYKCFLQIPLRENKNGGSWTFKIPLREDAPRRRTGAVFYLQKAGDKWSRDSIKLQNLSGNLKITGINEDQEGALYLLTNPDTGSGNKKCGIYEIVQNKSISRKKKKTICSQRFCRAFYITHSRKSSHITPSTGLYNSTFF